MRLLLATICCTLALTGAAAANPFAKYERAATAQFGPVGCQIEVSWFDDEAESGRYAGYAELGGCHMWLNWPYWHGLARYDRCMLFAHEYLHLLGYNHPGEGSEQTEWNRREAQIPHACKARIFYRWRG